MLAHLQINFCSSMYSPVLIRTKFSQRDYYIVIGVNIASYSSLQPTSSCMYMKIWRYDSNCVENIKGNRGQYPFQNKCNVNKFSVCSHEAFDMWVPKIMFRHRVHPFSKHCMLACVTTIIVHTIPQCTHTSCQFTRHNSKFEISV